MPESFNPAGDDWKPHSPRRNIPPHTILISFSFFCTNCGQEIRPVTMEDRAGNKEYCPNCEETVRCAVGIAVHANTPQELRYSMSEMERSIPLIHKVLSEWGSLEDEDKQ